jgi:hypothetical protein
VTPPAAFRRIATPPAAAAVASLITVAFHAHILRLLLSRFYNLQSAKSTEIIEN